MGKELGKVAAVSLQGIWVKQKVDVESEQKWMKVDDNNDLDDVHQNKNNGAYSQWWYKIPKLN